MRSSASRLLAGRSCQQLFSTAKDSAKDAGAGKGLQAHVIMLLLGQLLILQATLVSRPANMGLPPLSVQFAAGAAASVKSGGAASAGAKPGGVAGAGAKPAAAGTSSTATSAGPAPGLRQPGTTGPAAGVRPPAPGTAASEWSHLLAILHSACFSGAALQQHQAGAASIVTSAVHGADKHSSLTDNAPRLPVHVFAARPGAPTGPPLTAPGPTTASNPVGTSPLGSSSVGSSSVAGAPGAAGGGSSGGGGSGGRRLLVPVLMLAAPLGAYWVYDQYLNGLFGPGPVIGGGGKVFDSSMFGGKGSGKGSGGSGGSGGAAAGAVQSDDASAVGAKDAFTMRTLAPGEVSNTLDICNEASRDSSEHQHDRHAVSSIITPSVAAWLLSAMAQ